MTEDEIIDQALKQPLSDDAMRPANLHLDRTEGLRIDWADGRVSRYSLGFLRKRCPCATCRAKRAEDATAKPRSLSLTVLPAGIDRAAQFSNARLVGNYAIQITWADGHSTGIFDFRYLRVLDSEIAAKG